MIVLKSVWTLEYMRDAGKTAADPLVEEKDAVQPGVATLELDKIAEKYIRNCGNAAVRSGYDGFPGAICLSRNAEIVHGSPGLKKLKNGDTVNIDVGAEKDGCCDGAFKRFAGSEDAAAFQRLSDVTKASPYKGIALAMVKPRFGGVSRAVPTHGYGIVREYVGHGIGRKMHEDPQIPNDGSAGRSPKLTPEMTLALEPMFKLGAHEVKTLDDEWTAIPKDRKPSAYFEQVVADCGDAPEFLIKR